MMTKRCIHCERIFEPWPQVPEQTYCSSPDCQRARKRQWQRMKIRSDPDYRANQQAAQQAWTQRNRDYWSTHRDGHPAADAPRHEAAHQIADPKKPKRRRAKMDLSTLPSGIYRITKFPALMEMEQDSLVVEITLLRAM